MSKVLIRGGGDLASAIIQKLHRSGFEVIVKDLEKPKMVRRTVSYSNAMYEGEMCVEDLISKRADSLEEIEKLLDKKIIPVTALSEEEIMKKVAIDVFIDATLSKKEPEYSLDYAPIVIGLGPEIVAGKHAHIVVETARGHHLGRLIFEGKASENSHLPGNIMGYDFERVLRSPADGYMETAFKIGDHVKQGELIATVEGKEVIATLTGVLRGWIHPEVLLHKGMKIGDIDPRDDDTYCHYISDKGRNIAGGVLEAILMLERLDIS